MSEMAEARSSWFRLATRRDVVRRSLKVGLVVGTVLTAINQADAIVGGNVTMTVLVKIAMTYCVPY
ncbi:MAG: nitrate/nitrite transporter NrtS, partial [Pseudomonadota bacterium]